MYKVILTTNDDSKSSVGAIVNKKEYVLLETRYQFVGGFQRFDISLYSDDEPRQRSQFETIVVPFLKDNRAFDQRIK